MATDDGAISPDQPTDRPTATDRRCWRQAGAANVTQGHVKLNVTQNTK